MTDQNISSKNTTWKIHVIYLFVVVCLGGWIVYTHLKPKETNPENVKLLEDIAKIGAVRDSLLQERTGLRTRISDIESEIEKKELEIKLVKQKVANLESKVTTANNELKKSDQRVSEVKSQIENLEKNIPLKEGDDLLNSLKNKYK